MENAGPEERGTASRKERSGANPALKGKPAQVSTVRTEKLVFSLNYERLGNRANVAGTGTSLCRLMADGRLDRGLRPNDGGGGDEYPTRALLEQGCRCRTRERRTTGGLGGGTGDGGKVRWLSVHPISRYLP